MKFMKTEYNNTNEVLFEEMELGNYYIVSCNDDKESVEEVLMLCDIPINLTSLPNSKKFLVKSNEKEL